MLLNSKHLCVLFTFALLFSSNNGVGWQGMLGNMIPDVTALQKMAGSMMDIEKLKGMLPKIEIPDVEELKKKAAGMVDIEALVKSTVDPILNKLEFDPKEFVTKKVEELLGFKIDAKADPATKELVIFQMMIKASAQIPLKSLDPMALYNTQIDAAIAAAETMSKAFGADAAKPILEKVQQIKDACSDAVKTQLVNVVVMLIGTSMKGTAMGTDGFLGFVRKTLTMVLKNPDAQPPQRLETLLDGFIRYKAPGLPGQLEYHDRLVVCAVPRLVKIFTDLGEKEGNLKCAQQALATVAKLAAQFPQPVIKVAEKETTPKPTFPDVVEGGNSSSK